MGIAGDAVILAGASFRDVAPPHVPCHQLQRAFGRRAMAAAAAGLDPHPVARIKHQPLGRVDGFGLAALLLDEDVAGKSRLAAIDAPWRRDG